MVELVSGNRFEVYEKGPVTFYKLWFKRVCPLVVKETARHLSTRFKGTPCLTLKVNSAYGNEIIFEFVIKGYQVNGKPPTYMIKGDGVFTNLEYYLLPGEAIEFMQDFINELKTRKLIV
jgi:hypothetical protein